MKRLLLIGANPNNSTDGIIVRGITNFFDKYFPNKYQLDYLLISDSKPQIDFRENDKFSAIVYCGTPFLWDLFWLSHKYRNTVDLIKTHPEAKMVWFGIGSCFNLDSHGSIYSEIAGEKLKELFVDFSYQVIVRDSIAHYVLDYHKIDHQLLPCPSFLCSDPLIEESKDYNLMVWYDPQKGLSKDWWILNTDKYDDYVETFCKFYNKHKPIVACANYSDLWKARDLGFKDVQVWLNPEQTLYGVKHANKVLSGRVHIAVPSFVAGANVELVPVDTRANTLFDYRNLSPVEISTMFDPVVKIFTEI